MEENHYYPFGLTIEGISSRAAMFGGYENRYKFGGKELQNELGLNLYDFHARQYDQQRRQWDGIDALGEEMRRFSPYSENPEDSHIYSYKKIWKTFDPVGVAPTHGINATKM